jgi:anti-sigma regulatory factor (Ser/Thr protein kinase)
LQAKWENHQDGMRTALTQNGSRPESERRGEFLRVELDGHTDAAGRARRHLSRLRTELDPPLLESARLLITELVTNAVRHAHASTIGLEVAVSSGEVCVEVSNSGGGFEAGPSALEDLDSGWGLFLVDRLSDDWGVSHDDGTDYQRVWFQLARA